MKPWESFLTERDREVFERSGYGSQAGLLGRPALVVIDVSYSFVGDSPEDVRESAKRFRNSCGQEGWEAMERLRPLLAAFREKELPVVYTKVDTRYLQDNSWLFLEAWGAKNARAVEDTQPNRSYEHEIPDIIAPRGSDIVLPKTKPSAFHSSLLNEYLVRLGVNQVLCCGTSTSGCVRASVVDAFSNGYRTAVVEDCTFDRGQASHAMSLFDMQQKYADLISAEQAVKYAQGLPPGIFENWPPS